MLYVPRLRGARGRASGALAELLYDLGSFLERVIAGRRAAIGGLLQDDLLDVVRREATLGESGAYVQAELIPGAERHHGADHQDAAGGVAEEPAGAKPCPTGGGG